MAGRKLSDFLECGEIVNTHGVRGEVKISPWCDTPGFLLKFKKLYIDGREMKVTSSRVQKEMLLVHFEGIDDINAAMLLKGRTVMIARSDASLPSGSYFLSDAIGIDVYDCRLGYIGKLVDFLELPANRVFVVKGETEHLIPDVPEFIREVDIDAGKMTVSLIDGM